MPTKFQQEVVMEFEPLGKYKVRLVKEGTRMVLDIREYIVNERFTGFTRKGVRLSTTEEVSTLLSVLESLAKSDPFSGQAAPVPNGNGGSGQKASAGRPAPVRAR